MIPSHDFVNHHTQQYFNKSTNCTYLSSILIRLHSQYIKPYLSIVGNWIFFNILLKYTSLPLHYSEAYQAHYLINIPFIEMQPSLIGFCWEFRSSFQVLQLQAND